MKYSQINLTKVMGFLLLIVLILISGCNSHIPEYCEALSKEDKIVCKSAFKEYYISEGLCSTMGGKNLCSEMQYISKENQSEETNFPCAEGRECIDVCDGTLLVMRFGECEVGCTMYKDKLVGAYELKYALENCEVSVNSSQH